MDITGGFLIYVTLFRLAIIAVGAIAIVLGYRLFNQAIEINKNSVDVKGENWRVVLRNLAPGISFALFGTLNIQLYRADTETDKAAKC
jgi:hypothetical protein